MWRAVVLLIAGCGRLGFDAAGAVVGDAAPDAAALGALACGVTRTVVELTGVPLGLAAARTPDGAVVAWSASVAGNALTGVRLGISSDAIGSAEEVSTVLPQPVASFGLAVDDDARGLVVAPVASGVLLVPLDARLQAGGAWSVQPAAGVTAHAVAPPVIAGGDFVAAWIAGGDGHIARIDATGAPIAGGYAAPAGADVAVRRAARRDVVAWTSSGGGCEVWALDATFTPLIDEPLVHAPAKTCLEPAITRHDVGTNLLAWIDAGDAHAQLGTDTDVVGAQLEIGAGADDVEIAIAAGGFFVAVASGGAITPRHVRTDATGLVALRAVTHLPGSPLRLIEQATGALLVSIDGPAARPALQVTRLCEP